VDVLNWRRILVQAQTDCAVSRYDYIVSVIQLRLAAGNLSRTDVSEVNKWLAVSAPTILAQPLEAPAQPQVMEEPNAPPGGQAQPATTSHTRASTAATPLTPQQRLNQPQQFGQRAPVVSTDARPLPYGTDSKTSTAAF
jgi:hypothetical protein